MKKGKLVTIIICCIFVIFAGVFYFNSGTSSVRNDTSLITAKEPSYTEKTLQKAPVSKEIAVYICGAVKHPGVYKFSSDSRVCDAVLAAGGFKKNAAKTFINQARVLADGEQITIPTKKQLKADKKSEDQNSSGGNPKSDSGLVNINMADEKELMTLSGVGQSKAESIVAYRNEHGGFSKIEDIMKVTGIKEGVFNKIKDKITI